MVISVAVSPILPNPDCYMMHDDGAGITCVGPRLSVVFHAIPAPEIYLMSQKGFGRIAGSRVLGALGRAGGYTQPFQTHSETYEGGVGIHLSNQDPP